MCGVPHIYTSALARLFGDAQELRFHVGTRLSEDSVPPGDLAEVWLAHKTAHEPKMQGWVGWFWWFLFGWGFFKV